MQLNKVHHIDNLQGMATLPDNCANVIISDPPYYKVKGEFDFVFADKNAWLEFLEAQAIAYKRILKENGTLFIWGDAHNIAYVQVLFDKYFELESSIVWQKANGQNLRANPQSLRAFAPITERLLMYSNGEKSFGGCWEAIYSRPDLFLPVKNYMREQRKLAGLNAKRCYEICGVYTVDRHCFGDSQWVFITEANYLKLQAATGFFKKPYEALRTEYEALRRPFNLDRLITDVWHSDQQTHITKNYDHPTKKPERLASLMINTCSREGDLIVVPFAGSGTECAMAAKLRRDFIGYDTEAKYVAMSNERCKQYLTQHTLF